MNERFDGVVHDDIAVSPRGSAGTPSSALDPAIRAALEESIRRLRASCEAERETDAVTTFGTAPR